MQFIDLHRQYETIKSQIEEDLSKVLEHKQFIMGPEVKLLEKRLGEYTGVKHVISCASGTDALVIPLMAYGLSKTDAVFVPSFTFFASAESISLAGGTPVFVDCDRDTFNMSVESLKEAIETVRKEGLLIPRGIIAVDLFGLPANFEEIRKIADENNLFLLEDGAQGFGGTISTQKACSFGDIAATSFFPAKPLGCYGDGGAIFTNDDELAEKINSIHVHGQGVDKYDNIRIGLNSRLDTFQAAILNRKLDIFDNEMKQRNKIADLYCRELRSVVEIPVIPTNYCSSWAQFTIKTKDTEVRDRLMKKLKEKHIPTAIYYATPIHLSSAYKEHLQAKIDMRNTEEICKKVLSLPMHPYLLEEEIKIICDTIRENC